MLQKQINIVKDKQCTECGDVIPRYTKMYVEKAQAPDTDKILCAKCGSNKQAEARL